MSTPVAIKLSDLISKARTGALSDIVEREAEISRLIRILMRPTHHNVVLVAEPGSGKTSLVEALALRLSQGKYGALPQKMYMLTTDPIMSLLVNGDSLRSCTAALSEAASKLSSAIVVIEDIQLLAASDPGRLELTLSLLTALSANSAVRLITTTTETAYRRTFADDYTFSRLFYGLELPPVTNAQALAMVELAVPTLERLNHQQVDPEAVTLAVTYGKRFGHGRALPDAAIRLLEEACVKVSLDGPEIVSATDVTDIVSERERLPISDLSPSKQSPMTGLGDKLRESVVGQAPALRQIANHLAKASLGLRDPTKPRGSFLLLGPSGVGKTETAKALARTVYSGPQALIRLDMSEYQEAHSAVRLIGSPPGYVGYEEGGQLTGAVMREPYSLVLLDEIEKAHTKLFDLFLQLLDDGRLTDSSGKTVDFSETLVLATSNTGGQEISDATRKGIDTQSPEFMQDVLLPLLMHTYRPEFINRFDAVLVYQPLTLQHLVSLAQRELSQLQLRLATLGIIFNVTDETLADMLRPGLNPLFGARPVKRLIAGRFESPIAELIINRTLQTPVTITGLEPWLHTEVRA